MLFLDVQGTLIDDVARQPIDGAIALIDRLNRERQPYMVITNNTKYAPEVFHAYLVSLGLQIPFENYLDALMNLADHCPVGEIFAIGNEGFLETLQAMGYTLTKNNPSAVVIGIKEHLTYDDLADAVELILGGAKLIGMHETAVYAKNGRRYPGLGALLRAVEYATGIEATIVGKPSQSFYTKAKNQLGASSFEEITIVSDDPRGDLVGAQALGMKTIFVLSGKYHSADEILPQLRSVLTPDRVYPSVKELVL